MNFAKQFVFFLSVLGAFNGLILTFYFAFIARKKHFSNYFLALLLLTLSIRITKFVVLYYIPKLSGVFIQIGYSASILIGPFLYLYFRCILSDNIKKWSAHILPFLAVIVVVGIAYPYIEHRTEWNHYIIKSIYIQWFIYLIISFKFVKPILRKLFKKNQKLSRKDLWLLSIYSSVSLIWFAYNISHYYSNFLVGLSFSFALYVVILFFAIRNKKNTSFFEDPEKYKNKKLDHAVVRQIENKISIVKDNELYLNSNISLPFIAKELHVSNHIFSQFLNDNLNKSFSLFINELRIEKAKELITSPNPYTIEIIGYECGFNSKSSFFSTFKKLTGQTPSNYQKTNKKEV